MRLEFCWECMLWFPLMLEGVDATLAQTVILGPYYWGSSTYPGLAPGQSTVWALAILTPLPGPSQQKLQALTVTAVPMWDTKVQALSVSAVSVVGEPSGQLTVNFIVTNTHATSNCYGFKWWVAMVVP